MYTKVCILLLAIGLSQAVSNVLMPEAHLMQFMMRSRDVSQDNPARSVSCFSEYLPQLNEAFDDFQKEYAACIAEADEARLGIDDTTKDERDEIDASATSACQALDTCSQAEDSEKYFECYTEAGSDNTKVMYTISANSAELLAKVREDYRLIQVSEYACTNKSERAYVENSAVIYENFERCLEGLEPLEPSTTPTPSTSESTTPESSSEPSTPESSSEPSTPESSSEPSTPESSSEPSTPESSSEPSSPESSSEPSTPESSSPESSSEPSTPESSSEPSSPESSSEPSTPESSSEPSSPESSSEPSTPESSSEPSSPESSSEPSTPESSSTSAAPEEKLPEEDLSHLAAEQNKLQQIIDNMQKWLKRQ